MIVNRRKFAHFDPIFHYRCALPGLAQRGTFPHGAHNPDVEYKEAV